MSRGTNQVYVGNRLATFACFYLIVLLSSIAQAQVPGYLGKRHLLIADLNLFPGFSYAQSANVSIPVNTRASLIAERVLSRKISMGLGAGYFHTQFFYETPNGEGFANIDGYGLTWNTKFYTFRKRGNIAPVGPYQQIEVMYMRYHVRDQDGEFYVDQRENLGDFGDLATSLTFGLRHIMFDRLSVHIGMQYAFVLGAIRTGTGPARQVRRLSIDRLRGHFGINYNAGVGFLLF